MLIDRLTEYRQALADEDSPRLEHLLAEGRIRKKEIDG